MRDLTFPPSFTQLIEGSFKIDDNVYASDFDQKWTGDRSRESAFSFKKKARRGVFKWLLLQQYVHYHGEWRARC